LRYWCKKETHTRKTASILGEARRSLRAKQGRNFNSFSSHGCQQSNHPYASPRFLDLLGSNLVCGGASDLSVRSRETRKKRERKNLWFLSFSPEGWWWFIILLSFRVLEFQFLSTHRFDLSLSVWMYSEHHNGRLMATCPWYCLSLALGIWGIGVKKKLTRERQLILDVMSTFVGVLVSDPGLQSQFTQVQLRTLKTKVSNQSIQFHIKNLMVSACNHIDTSYLLP